MLKMLTHLNHVCRSTHTKTGVYDGEMKAGEVHTPHASELFKENVGGKIGNRHDIITKDYK